jgi:hypothetical protein
MFSMGTLKTSEAAELLRVRSRALRGQEHSA